MKKVLVLLIGVLLITGCSNKEENDKDAKIEELLNVRYHEVDNMACITFYGEGRYSMYDCDSEPTNYFFDSESECTYELNGNKMNFKCEHEIQEHKNNYIEILEWTKDTFKFKMDGKIKEFKGEENE